MNKATGWTRPVRLSALAVTLMLTAGAMAADWQTVNKGEARTDISTYEKAMADSPVKAFRGVTEVQASVLSVLAVMADTNACSEWLYQCQSLELRDNDQAYLRLKGIWPAKDRDALIKTHATQNKETGAITLASQAVDGEPEHAGYVRVAALEDQFVLTPLDNGWTRIEFETFIDPGGNVSSVANVISHKAPQETLQELREMARSETYQKAGLDQAVKRYSKLKGIDLPQSHQPE
ncbi:START domain-containing protein [Alcanivorax sp.]|jgi:hypothetical protein|uniref:START domain-containing protein n=1 Tax=Alcanivorax sp. TaxID=1872427 RepID=UPI0032D92031